MNILEWEEEEEEEEEQIFILYSINVIINFKVVTVTSRKDH